jgi:hypothetical protein
MAGNRSLILETVADPDALLLGKTGETLALRAYAQTSLTAKAAVVIYRNEPDGFIITAWLTSRADGLTGNLNLDRLSQLRPPYPRPLPYRGERQKV